MFDVTRLNEVDLSTIDFRAITPEQWVAVKGEVVRRAHAARAEAMRSLLKGLASWWPNFRWRRDSIVQGYETSPSRSFPLEGRA
jgi:hypothetical protein